MDIFDLLSSEEACSKLFRKIRWANNIYCPRCGSLKVKGHGNYMNGLKRYFCKSCKRTFNDKTGTDFHYSRISFREWFTIMLLFFGLHNSCYSLSWLLDRSQMTIFKALKKLMLRIRSKIKKFKLKGTAEVDELYINSGLKSRNNSLRIKNSGRVARKRGFRKRGRGLWIYDKPAIFILVNRNGKEDYVPSKNVESETVFKIINRRIEKGSKIYSDNFKSYIGLNELGYNHEYVNHSINE